jgi:tetratricopeptide (TPR) repeat protein
LLIAIFLTALITAGLAGYHLYLRAEPLALLEQGAQLAEAGDIEAALAQYRQAEQQTVDPTFEISAASWNTLCWFGSLWQHAAEVRFACERAVALEPTNGAYRDSRGLARALLGDYDGAAADFRFFIEWSQQTGQYEPDRLKRAQWLTQLAAGQNPFDAATLAELRAAN